MRVRAAGIGDLPAIKKLVLESPSAAQWSDENFNHLFAPAQSVSRHALVVDESDALVGFIVAHQIGTEWELENIVVASAARGKGTGKQLMRALLQLAASGDATTMHLEVRESNHTARRLYESCGFHETRRRKGYYLHPQEDAVLYSFPFSSPKK